VRLRAIGVALSPAFARGAFAADCSSTEICITPCKDCWPVPQCTSAGRHESAVRAGQRFPGWRDLH